MQDLVHKLHFKKSTCFSVEKNKCRRNQTYKVRSTNRIGTPESKGKQRDVPSINYAPKKK